MFVDKDMILVNDSLITTMRCIMENKLLMLNKHRSEEVNKRSNNIQLFVYIMKKQSNTFNHHLLLKYA